MAKYLDLFPKIAYDPTKTLYSTNFNTVTNILFRIGMVKEYVNNTSAYYEYVIQDGEKPEILAERFYGSPEAHWVIILANDIVDPQYDWPLNYDEFNNYVVGKYGSVASAKTTIHHYEKIVTREEPTTGSFFTYKYVIDFNRQSDYPPSVPYDTYLSLPDEQTFQTYSVGGKTIVESISRNAVTNYDYEVDQNEAKREIRIIKSEYYRQLVREFEDLVLPDDFVSYLRTIR